MSDGLVFVLIFALGFACGSVMHDLVDNKSTRLAEKVCKASHGEYRVCMANELWLKEPKP
jgi:hypothetical protein